MNINEISDNILNMANDAIKDMTPVRLTTEQRIAELERHNELLLTIAHFARFGKTGKRTRCPICEMGTGHANDCPYKTAIDGGALGKEDFIY